VCRGIDGIHKQQGWASAAVFWIDHLKHPQAAGPGIICCILVGPLWSIHGRRGGESSAVFYIDHFEAPDSEQPNTLHCCLLAAPSPGALLPMLAELRPCTFCASTMATSFGAAQCGRRTRQSKRQATILRGAHHSLFDFR
jgi:hypothetical protein